MRCKRNCWELESCFYAVAEHFFLSLKMELIWQRTYENKAEAKIDVVSYIDGFYSSGRLHSILGNLPPAVSDRKMAAKEPIAVSENI